MVDATTLYNAILGYSTLNPNRMVHLTYHQIMKFRIPHGIGVVRDDDRVTRSCYVYYVWCYVLKKNEGETLSIQVDEDPREEKSCPTLIEGLKKVQLDGVDKVVQVWLTLSKEKDRILKLLLIEFKERFARKASDMSGVR